MYMYRWKPEMIRFMQNASEYGIYHKQLASIIAEQIPQSSTVCDVGCGLGYLSIELSKLVKQVTAIDINKDVIDILNVNKDNGRIQNMTAVCADIHSFVPQEKFDAMVFCFFGKTDEVFEIVKAKCRGKAFVISRSWGEHRFSVTPQSADKLTAQKVCEVLKEKKIPFKAESFSAQMGQPFESREDAVLFFNTYNKDKNVESVTFDSISDRLVPVNYGKFRYYLPLIKEMCVVSFNAENLKS